MYVTPSFSSDTKSVKGGDWLLKIAKDFEHDNKLLFLVIGPNNSNLVSSKNVLFLGKILDQNELSKYYSMASLTLLTSKKETFSMVTIESLCCGTPVVGYKAGGPESIAIEQYSTFVTYGDFEGIKKAIIQTLTTKWDKNEISKRAIGLYSKKIMYKRFMTIYKELQER